MQTQGRDPYHGGLVCLCKRCLSLRSQQLACVPRVAALRRCLAVVRALWKAVLCLASPVAGLHYQVNATMVIMHQVNANRAIVSRHNYRILPAIVSHIKFKCFYSQEFCSASLRRAAQQICANDSAREHISERICGMKWCQTKSFCTNIQTIPRNMSFTYELKRLEPKLDIVKKTLKLNALINN